MSERKCANCGFWAANLEPVTHQGEHPCYNPNVGGLKGGDLGTDCLYFMGADCTEANVPNHTAGATMFEADTKPVDGPTEILIVTYWKDAPWLEYCLRTIQRHCRGFSGVTVVTPDYQPDGKWIPPGFFDQMSALGPVRITSRYFKEVPGKGMLHHMAIMGSADEWVPAGTKYVLHHDADGMFKMETTPEHYFADGKPYWLIRTWASLGVEDRRHPVSKIRSDCAQWKIPTDAQLGWDTEWYTMCVNTQAIPIEFYFSYRRYLEQRHRQKFLDYMTSGRNEFPQTIMDWTAMGAWCHRYMREHFTWFDVESGQPFPGDRKKAYHSHSGLSDEIREEIEGFLT